MGRRAAGVCPAPPPAGAPRAAPGRASPAPLDVMWTESWRGRRGRGPSGGSTSGRPAPCAPRLAPGPARAAATSGSVQRVCPSAPAGGQGRAGAGWVGRRGARRSRAPGVSLSLPLQKQLPARTALGAARPGAAAPRLPPRPPELPDLFDGQKPRRGRGGLLGSGERAESLQPRRPGAPSPRRGSPPPPLLSTLLALPLPIYFFKWCGRRRCGAKFLEGARMY